MEIDAFYELRSRLYAAAAAGCGMINEDFRLKRALEAFRPLSEANKAFGRLYLICEGLFTAENPSNELTDCIALADALAVAQGSFLDKSETKEKETGISLQPQTISHSYLEEVKEALFLGKIDTCHDAQTDVQYIKDPRLFSVFIDNMVKNTMDLRSIADVLFPQFGEEIISFLKEQLDLKDNTKKNKTGYYVELICKLCKEQENDWYLSLIEHEEYPDNIRAAAVRGLEYSMENVPKLLELSKTQKGVVKTAAILSLAKLDPPEAEELWKKLTAKYKDSYVDFMIQSKSDICAEFARRIVMEALASCEESCGKGKLTREAGEKKEERKGNLDLAVRVICRKPQLEDCFLLFAEKYDLIKQVSSRFYYRDWKDEINQVLIENLLEEDECYCEMIKNVYDAYKDFYFPARFFLALKEMGVQAFFEYEEEIAKNRTIAMRMIYNTRYDPVRQGYYLCWDCMGHLYGAARAKGYELKLFDRIPEKVFLFVTDTDYFVPKEKNSSLSSQRTYPEHIRSAMEYAVMILKIWCTDFKAGSDEYKRYTEAAVKFALKLNQYCSIGEEIEDIILKYYTHGESKEYRGILTNYFIQRMQRGESIRWKLDMLDKMPMSLEDKKQELLDIKKQVEKFEKMDQNKKNDVLSDINRILKTTYCEN